MSDACVAIIPARAGSKRLPGKNIARLGAHSLLERAIRSALDCRSIADTFVSTDSEDYQRLAVAAGAQCPALRSAELGADTATSADVVLELLASIDPNGTRYQSFVLLQPTSPFRTASDVADALAIHRQSGRDVVSVCEAECPPAWIGQLAPDGTMDDFIRPASRGLRSQDLGVFHRLNGAIYVMDCTRFRAAPTFMPAGTLACVMPRERSVDIDTPADLALARAMLASNIVE